MLTSLTRFRSLSFLRAATGGFPLLPYGEYLLRLHRRDSGDDVAGDTEKALSSFIDDDSDEDDASVAMYSYGCCSLSRCFLSNGEELIPKEGSRDPGVYEAMAMKTFFAEDKQKVVDSECPEWFDSMRNSMRSGRESNLY